MSEPGTNREI